jgi:hypothetical protein
MTGTRILDLSPLLMVSADVALCTARRGRGGGVQAASQR